MTEVLPFRGVLYNRERFSGDDVVSPPYDIITPEMKDHLYSKSPYNFVRIDFGKDLPDDDDDENRYSRSSRFFKEWIKEGVLLQSEKPCFYLGEVRYTLRGEEKVMRGLFGRVRITDLCEGVYPHEETHSKPKADRLNLMRACNANLSPIFSVYNSPEVKSREIFDRISSGAPYLEARDPDGAVHRLWVIDDQRDIDYLRERLSDIAIYIADGHHRYETALEYRKEMMKNNPSHTGEEPYNFVLMYLVNIPDGGLSILPTHRLLRGLSLEGDDPEKAVLVRIREHFEIRSVEDPSRVIEEIENQEHSIGLFLNGLEQGFVLRHNGVDLPDVPPPLRDLDVTVLHELIIGELFPSSELAFEMDPELTLRKVKAGEYQAAFFLRPTSLEEVEKVSLECLRMPPKSTYFYPKILTGLVINRLDIE